MKKLALFTVLGWLAATPLLASEPSFTLDKVTIQSTKTKHSFTVEIARSQSEHELGLMFRSYLLKDHGMLFLYLEDRVVRMWMKDTKLSLDMLFIDKNGKIIYIAENTKPYSTETITAGKPVRAVLEVIAGTAKRKHIKVGDTVIHRYFSDE